jgi:hypothetical protein
MVLDLFRHPFCARVGRNITYRAVFGVDSQK